MPPGFTLGLNQYTHSAACCILDEAGEPVIALEKERVTRKKHDGGDVAVLVEAALAAAGLEIGDLALVVANNHLFRIAPFEEVLRWQVALHQWRPSYLDRHNLLPGVPRHELSHHLAHAWSVLPLCPFDEGLIVVLDGMGSRRRDALYRGRGFTGEGDLAPAPDFEEWPRSLDPGAEEWREAESVYAFRGLELRRLWKRWARGRQPAFLHNYGFEDLEGLGAVYSRVASHVFGDWNSCGKVMGLAPWARRWCRTEAREGAPKPDWLLRGPLERLRVNRARLLAEPYPNGWGERGSRAVHARLARDVQRDLESVLLPFLRRLRRRSGTRNLCLAGGVALNSVLNGRVAGECGFENVFVPPWPGDEGVAVGCALFGHHRLRRRRARPRRSPFPPFLGRAFGSEEVAAAIREHASWVRELPPPEAGGDEEPAIAAAADALARGAILGWYQGRAELGPRALGNRSILAHPGRRGTWKEVNRRKGREAFRPLAPVVLAEHAAAFFPGAPGSPWMSFTSPADPARARRLGAVLHVDGSARLQTLREEDNPRFHALLCAFHRRTGLPILLNTSFNRAGEPLVDTPADAIRCFLDAGLDLLVLQDRLLELSAFPPPASQDQWIPRHDPSFTASVQSDALGEALQVLVMAGGRTHSSDTLELAVLEACDGSHTLQEVVRAFTDEFEETPGAILERLERLWRARLLRLESAPGAAGRTILEGPGPGA